MSDALWILITACLVALVCAIPGSLLMLKRQAMMGDAIAHAVLPGVFLAFWFSGDRSVAYLIPGAALGGWAAAQWSTWLMHRQHLASDSAMGLVFTFLFATGIILISAFAKQIDLDLDCVLFGDIVWAPLDRLYIGSTDLGPISVWLLGGTLGLFILTLYVGWRGWLLTTFDVAFAQSLGYKIGSWNSMLMAMVSLATVVCFHSVGSVLVIALLSVPAATASLYVRSLGAQLFHACLWGAISALLGWALALPLNISVSGAMACASAFCFSGVWFYTAQFRQRNRPITL
jgi:manganese/zinc/iron transport system permease protein